MAPSPALLAALLLALVFAAATANPLKNPYICGRPTCVAGSKFLYQPDTRYEYSYSTEVATLFHGTSRNESTLRIQASVALHFLTRCEGILHVENVNVTEGALINDVFRKAKAVTKLFGDDISQHPLRFSFTDGIFGELCPANDEKSWVLNFKRGILSAFQNSMRRFDVSHETIETDVHGDCTTRYSLERAEGTSLILSKTKDFATCSNRNKFNSVLQTTPYVFHSAHHGVPVMRSRSTCSLSVDHNVYNKIDCSEVHVFQPFSSGGDSGATTRVRQVLELRDEIIERPEQPDNVERRVPILFDHDLTPKPTSGELRASRDQLKVMCHLSDADVQPQFPDAFSKFIRTARVLSANVLTQLYIRGNSICPTARRHLLSALPLLGSNAAVSVMRDFMLRRVVPRETAREWLFFLAFLPRPDLHTLEILTPLLTKEEADSEEVLSVASVVHTYCRAHSSCAQDPQVEKILSHLQGQLHLGIQENIWKRLSLEKTIVAVKALGNIGQQTSDIQESLQSCVSLEHLPLDLRIACIEAQRRMPCEEMRSHFLELFRNKTADPEMRIAAYLQVMRCPNYNVIKTIQRALQEEEVNQVGSFVWTHLNNLVKSSIPSRVELQGLLQQRDLDKKFSSDARKYSHNFQGSVFFDEYNAGGNYDSNLIFSPKSYIPRSAMLNLTVDLFGQSINLFEVSGRLEGFEHYIESLFGPHGPYSGRKVNDKVDKVLQRVRFARDTRDNLVDLVDEVPNVIDNNFNNPKVSFGFKIFGNELRYHTLDGDKEIRSAINSINPITKLQKLLSGQEINYNKAAMFLDADYVMPTGAGLPLTLNAFGTTAVSLKMSGSLKASNFLETGVLDVNGTVRPSVAVNVIGSMGVDAYYASTAIKLKTNLYTSSAVDSQLKIRGKRLVSLSFNLPKDKIELLTAESELVVTRGEEEMPQRGVERGRVEKRVCSWPSLDQTLGLNFCADMQFPNATLRPQAPRYLLTGPSRFSVAIRKADLSANKFLVEYKWVDMPNNGSAISLVFDTPGSAQKREMSIHMNMDNKSQNLTLLVQSVAAKYEALGKYRNTEGEKSIHFTLDVNGRKKIDVELSLKTKRITNGLNYFPRFYLAVNQSTVAELSGTLRCVEKIGVSQWDVDLEFRTRKLESKLTGFVKRSEVIIDTSLKLEYQFQNATEESVVLKAQLSNRNSKVYTHAEANVQIESSAYPQYNVLSSLVYQSTQGHFQCVFELNYGLKINDQRNKLTLSVEFTFAKTYDGTKINFSTRVTKPISDINLKFTLSYASAGAETNVKSVIRYASEKEIHITLDFKVPRSTLTFIEAKLNVTLPSFHPMVLDVKLHEKKPNDYNVDIIATWFSGHMISAKGVYQDKSTHKAASHNIKMLIKSPSFEEIAVTYKYLCDETELKMEMQADHNKDKYYAVLKHANPRPAEYETYVEARIKSSVYSLLTTVSLVEHRQIVVQLHLDRVRDIHLMMRSLNRPERKEASVEVKWDANRDPSQKVAAAVQYLHPEPFHYSGFMMTSYPGRTIRGTYLFNLRDSRCDTSAHFEWSPTDAIQVTAGVIYEYENALVLGLKSELLTPFESWRRTSLMAGIRHQNNLFHANSSVHWHDDQNIALNLFGDYAVEDDSFSCEMNASIISTIPQVSSMSGSFSHKKVNNIYDTHVYLQHFPQKAIFVKSTWQLEEDEESTNLTGKISLQSPYPGYHDGVMLCRMHISSDWDVKGAADLTIDRRKYTFGINGYVKKLTDNMLVFNITTPIENYAKITGRFGYSGEKKHLVAGVKAPTGEIGLEILFQFQNTNNFDIKFNLATPMEFLQKALLIAKLKEQVVDLRCGWNNLIIGFFGQWHYENITDFEYCYKIYTPIEGFHENGVVAKIIKRGGLDSAIGFNLGDSKLGVKVQGAPKPRVAEELKLANKQLAKTEHKTDAEEDEYYDSDDDDEDWLSWKGLLEVDTFFHPTFKGTLEIDENDSTYIVVSSLTLPNGTAVLHDELFFTDMLNISNSFHLATPYPQLKEMHSEFKFSIDLDRSEYITKLNVGFKRNNNSIESGISMKYKYDEGEESDLQIHAANLKIFTPFEILKLYVLQAQLEVEDNIYRTNIKMATGDSNVTTSGYLQAEEGYIETSVNFAMMSPVYSIPSFQISGKRDVTHPLKRFELMFEKLEPTNKLYKFNGHWNLESSRNFQIGMQITSPHKSIPSAAADILFTQSPDNGNINLNILLAPLPEHALKINSAVLDNQFAIYMETPIENYRKISINGTIQSEQDNLYKVLATVICDEGTYNMEGTYVLNTDSLLKVDLKLNDNQNGKIIVVHTNIQPMQNGYNISSGLQNGDDNFNIHGSVQVIHILDFNLHMKATSTHPTYKLISLDAVVQQQSNRNITIGFSADSSIPNYEKIRYTGNILLQERSGELKSHLITKDINTSINTEWMLELFENILLSVNGHFQDKDITKHALGKVFFHLPRTSKKNQKKILTLGIDINLDKDTWQFGSNATVAFASIENIEAQAHFKLPKPNHEIHSFLGKVQLSTTFENLDILAKYKTLYSNKNYGISCQTNKKKADIETIQGNLKLEYGYGNENDIDNKWEIEKDNRTFNVIYTLNTPYYSENTIKATFYYDGFSQVNHIRTRLYYPENNNVTQASVDFIDFSNMNGTVISNTPFEALSHAGINFKVYSQRPHYIRYAEVFWPNNTAVFDSIYTYEQQHFTTNINGSLSVEIPLATRHNGKINYAYKEEPLQKTGHADIKYNEKKILEGNYRCDSESSAGHEKDKIKIDLENELFPLGILYTHQYHYSGGHGGLNLPTTDIKQAEVFKLNNKTAFHLTGELNVRTTFTGQDILITAKHLKRVVQLRTDYDEIGNEFRHRSTLTLDPKSWASYDILIVNKTMEDKDEEHIELNFSYPQRNFTAFGYYQLMNNSLSSELNFVWDKEKPPEKHRSVGTSLEWKRLSYKPNKQHATFSLKHPSFVRPVTLSGLYFSNNKDILDVSADLVYSNDTHRKLSLSGKVEDVSQPRSRKYQYEILGSHPATSLDLRVKGDIMLEPGLYQTHHKANYKRSYIPQDKSELNGKIDTRQKEIHFEKKTNDEIHHIRTKYIGKYPAYRINGTMSRGKAMSSVGDFNLHFEEKILLVTVNTTEDESERNFYIDGNIPDSRNAIFNIWTDYEDIRVSDVTFYLRLNHSRLVTSKLRWRPELENEIKTDLEELGDQIWNGTFENIDYWTNYIKSEASDAIKDIWRDAQPFIDRFLDDVEELESLKEDYENFRVYLNESYNNNDFYIQDIVSFCNKLMDDLSIRGHIESLPAFVKEIWEIMGESGEAIIKSLRWIIDTVKTSYHKAVQFINSLMKGDLTSRIAELMEKLGEKYDKFIRDLRVTSVKYMTDLWHSASAMLLEHWNNFVLAVEPTFVTIAHYVETAVWKVSTEVVDFMYQRKTELVESPYFSKFANFTQDIDRFYKDIMKNDILTNIRKYSKIIYEFIQDKYFAMVPFGKELEDVANEIITELKVIQKLPSIKYAIDKSNELYDKIVWVYNYLDLGTQIQNAVTIIHLKITDITQTALQAENRYREAKTLFIFDPETGHVVLEQKLPMSWHAFNETPRFEEIPEYKAISELQNYFASSNITFWTLYYEYKPYSEPSNWLPPFNAQAMIAGTQHFMTFDHSFYEFQGSCSYLLASDFVDRNFSLVISFDATKEQYIISVVIEKQVINIDLFNDVVTLSTNEVKLLPLQIGDTYVYQEASMVTVDSAKGFYIQCNMKFDVCVVKLSGWYFGKTAGLLGTLDNEPSTDFITPKKVIENDLEKFTHSWVVNKETCSSAKNNAIRNHGVDDILYNKCNDFFKTKSSQFSSCFSRVDSTPFWNMCINSRNTSDKDPCTIAVAYMQACLAENTPLRIPESCIKCRHLVNDIEVPEGDFRQIENENVPRSTDIVFIIQAGSCNNDIKNALSLDELISDLNKELSETGFTSNRYAVVVFGGKGVFNEPRSITINNNVFTNEEHILEYFDHIPSGGNGSTDIFEGIRFATQLIFRPGVSKTFILIPCSSCEPSKMILDYSVLHQVLLENGIKFHILMNDEFHFKKPKGQKVIFGMDKEAAYTNKDIKALRGDGDLKKQVREPKFQLGICSALAMETNGTVFSAKLLKTDKKNMAKKLLTVFAKRVALTAEPYSCQKCECTADNNGISYMECFPCEYPQPSPYSYTSEDIERAEYEDVGSIEDSEE